MPEGVGPYPRWQGTLRTGSLVDVIAWHEVRRALRDTWAVVAILGALVWGFASVAELYNFRQSGDTTIELNAFLSMLDQLRWFALGIAATVGVPSLLEDQKRGALELYLSRAVTTWEYLGGKLVAVFTLTTGALFVPTLAYFVASFLFFDVHPADWWLAPIRGLLYAVLWGLLVTGLAFGLSSVGRSALGATILLFGGFALLDLIVSKLLAGLTADERLEVISPFAAFHQQTTWMFGVPQTYAFPAYWGLVAFLLLMMLGWGLFFFKRPRVRGEEPGRA